jgi:hypothetical protein
LRIAHRARIARGFAVENCGSAIVAGLTQQAVMAGRR